MPQERRLVTVLFADIVDSSASARAHDPEVVREALGATFARAREVLAAHGGTVEKFIGDAVMAVFGVPTAHEDDAERAVRAALELRSAGRDPARAALQFTMRIGIESGEVVSGDGSGGEFLVTGNAVNAAARLEQAAVPGEILVGPLAYELTRRDLDYGEPRTVLAKGIGPIEAWSAVGVTSSREPRQGRETLFVDRTEELQLVAGFSARAARSARAHLVTVIGDPGVGKSRLLREFLRGRPRSLRAACLPYGRAITYWPLQELVRLEAGIAPTDDLEAARAKITAAVAGPLDTGGPEVVRTAEQLSAFALSGQIDLEGAGGTDPPRELARALRRYVEGRVRAAPAAYVIEDLHWAEEPLLELLDGFLSELRAPLLMLCTARRELLDRRLPWGAARANALTIDLEPLVEAESRTLAAALIGDDSDPRIGSIVERTEGNPLFVEEYVRALADRRPDDVPATLHGVIAARLDASPPPLRRMLQAASVLGREFWIDALPTEGEEDRASSVDEGIRRDLISHSTRPGPSGTRTLRFKHALIRDVAYASLSKADRSRLHDHHSQWLAAAAGDRANDHLEIVLYHAERAYELAREVNSPATSVLARRAFDALRRTAGLASARPDPELTLEMCRRALSVASVVTVDARERALVQGMAAIARIRLESSEEAIAELDRAIEAVRPLDPTMDLVRLLTWRASTSALLDDIVSARALYAEAVEVARRTGDADAIAYALWTSAEPLRLIGRLREHRRALEDALAHMHTSGSDRWMASALVELSASALAMGDAGEARLRAEEALAIAESAGRRLDRYLALEALARALLADRDPSAREVAERTLALASELGGPAPLAAVTDVAAEAMERDGDRAAAEALVSDVLARLDPIRTPTLREFIARLEAIRARLALARDDLDGASAAAATALEVAPRSNVVARAHALIAGARVARASGRDEEADRLAMETRTLLEPTDHALLQRELDASLMPTR